MEQSMVHPTDATWQLLGGMSTQPAFLNTERRLHGDVCLPRVYANGLLLDYHLLLPIKLLLPLSPPAPFFFSHHLPTEERLNSIFFSPDLVSHLAPSFPPFGNVTVTVRGE